MAEFIVRDLVEDFAVLGSLWQFIDAMLGDFDALKILNDWANRFL
jgi:hypothetical protein